MSNEMSRAFLELIKKRGSKFASELDKEEAAFLVNGGKCSGEITKEAFNPILHGHSALPTPGVFLGDRDDAARIFRIAAILFRLAMIEGNTSKTKFQKSDHLGWDQLNLDAKGFCKWVLTCRIPDGLPSEALTDLLEAKTIVGLLIADLLPEIPRDIQEICEGVIINDPGIDD